MHIHYTIHSIKNAIKAALVAFHDGGARYANIVYTSESSLLSGKNILITGGGSGIGLAIAKKYVKNGARVIIVGRDEVKLKKAVSEIGSDKSSYIVWDISKVNEAGNIIKRCEAQFGGPIAVLVNNAGIPPKRFFGSVDEIEWDTIYNTNLKGMFFLTQAIVKAWTEIGGDIQSEMRKIINISSQGGFVGATYPYRMVKWDIRGLTEGLGKSLIKKGIIVNGIAPGVVKTAMQSFSMKQGDNIYTNQNPIERVILPEEIAEIALFLASDISNTIVGQTIICDGGYTLK